MMKTFEMQKIAMKIASVDREAGWKSNLTITAVITALLSGYLMRNNGSGSSNPKKLSFKVNAELDSAGIDGGEKILSGNIEPVVEAVSELGLSQKISAKDIEAFVKNPQPITNVEQEGVSDKEFLKNIFKGEGINNPKEILKDSFDHNKLVKLIEYITKSGYKLDVVTDTIGGSLHNDIADRMMNDNREEVVKELKAAIERRKKGNDDILKYEDDKLISDAKEFLAFAVRGI